MRASQPVRVGFRCDVDVETGVGHLVRCVALAEELLGRGVEVVFLSDLGGVEWAERQLSSRSIPVGQPAHAAADVSRQAASLALDAVVLDGYRLDPETGRTLRRAGIVVLNVVDAEFGRQDADIYLDQNLDSEHSSFAMPDGGERLAGIRYVLLRDVVRVERPSTPRAPRTWAVLDVLAFFGGTDAFGAGPVVVPLILRTGAPMHIRVVAPRPEIARHLEALPTGQGQRVEILGPRDDMPRLATTSDLVAAASGSSAWELMCLGVTTAVVAVSDNQQVSYQVLLDEGIALGLGRLDELRLGAKAQQLAVRDLSDLLRDHDRRAAMSALGWALVDGRGRERVADALMNQLASRIRTLGPQGPT